MNQQIQNPRQTAALTRLIVGVGLLMAGCASVTIIPAAERIEPNAALAPSGNLATEPMLRFGDNADAGLYGGVSSDTRGRYVVTATYDKTAKVWTSDGRMQVTLRPPSGEGAVGNIGDAGVSPDGAIVALGWRGPRAGAIYLFDRATGHILRHLDGLPNLASSLRFSPDGRLLAVAIVSGGVLVFDVASGREIGRDVAYGGDSFCVDFSADGRRLLVTSLDGYLHVYGVGATGISRLGVVQAGDGSAMQSQPVIARFSPDGRWLAVGFKSLKGIVLREATTLRYVSVLMPLDQISNVVALDWSADGGSVYASVVLRSSDDPVVRRWTRGDLSKPNPWNMFEVKTRDFSIHGHADISSGPIALRGGGILVAMQDLSWGVIDEQGHTDWRHAPARMATGGYQASVLKPMRPPVLGVSSDGSAVVTGNYLNLVAEPFGFDLRSRRVQHDVTQPQAPTTTAPGMVFNAEDVYSQSGQAPVILNGHTLPLNTVERVTSAAIDGAAQQFVLGTTENVRLYDRDAHLRWLMPGAALAVNVSADGRWVVTKGIDQIIRWVRTRDGSLALSLYKEPEGDRWVAWTPSGLFDAAPGAEDLMGWQINQGPDAEAIFYPLSRFRATFQRPDVMARLLDTVDEHQALKLADAASQRVSVVESIAQALPPRVELIDAPASFDAPDVQIRVHITSPADAPVQEIRVRINGKFNPKARGKVNSLEGDQTLHLALPRADATIEVFAINRNATSQALALQLHYRPGADTSTQRIGVHIHKPRLFVLAVGISDYQRTELNLHYASADARDFAHLFEAQQGHYYAAVMTKVITDREATREHVLAGFKWLSSVAAESDVAIVFLAGHGMQLPDGSYHFATADVDPENLRTTSVDDATIRRVLGEFAARGNDVLLFVDTCYSGGVVSRNIVESSGDGNNRALEDRENNVVVFAASSDNKLSFESSDWHHGAFTKVLIDGLRDWKADPFQSGEITHADLSAYVQKFLPAMTKQQQVPHVFTPLGDSVPFIVEAR